MKLRDYKHFECSTCGRLTSKPWDAVWCLHHDSNFQPRPPEHRESDWTRMNIVTKVKSEPPPDVPWFIVLRDSRGVPSGDYKDKDEVTGGPLSQDEALQFLSDNYTALEGPRHLHHYDAYPQDLLWGKLRKQAEER